MKYSKVFISKDKEAAIKLARNKKKEPNDKSKIDYDQKPKHPPTEKDMTNFATEYNLGQKDGYNLRKR